MPYVVGVVVSAAVAVFARCVGFDRDRAFYPTVMIVIALYYVLFAVMGGVSELAWLLDADTNQQVLRRLAPEVFGSRFAGSPILTTIPLFTFVGYTMAESKTWKDMCAQKGWISTYLAGPAFDAALKQEISQTTTVLKDLGLAS